MQKLVAILSLALAVTGETPYAASGWKPNGPAFELPQRGAETPQNYLPPVDPRNPRTSIDAEDVSVQGLPVPEPLPQFRVSPVSGQQYVGPAFQKDLRGIDEKYRQAQYQQQQQRLRELARQQQLYSAPSTTQTNRPSQVPRQFVPGTTAQPTTLAKEQRTTTESLNTGEVLDDEKTPANLKKEKVSVEITKQQIQEYPPELFLGPLAQVKVQAVRTPGQQFAQLVYQPTLQEINQKQSVTPAFDGVANLGLVQSILAQSPQQSAALLAPREPNPHFVLISSANQDLNQYQPLAQQYQLQPVLLPAQLNQFDQAQNKKEPEVRDVEKDDDDEKTSQDQLKFVSQPQFAPQQPQVAPQQFVPQQQQFVPQQQQFVPQQQQFVPEQQQFVPQQQQFVPQQQQFVQQQQQQFVPQQQQIVPQQQQFVPQQKQLVPQQQQLTPQQQQFVSQQQQFVPQQQQFVVEQPQMYQPQEIQYQYQPQAQSQLNYQPTNEDINMYYQQQQLLLQLQQQQLLVQQQQVFQRQNQPQGIQTDLGDGQQNNLDQQGKDEDEDNQNGGQVATAVATAFGDRSRPRVLTQYGAPLPAQSTTENDDEEATTTEAPVAAEATAVARGSRRKSAKLRARRVRPIFGVDKSGHLVQLQELQ